MESKKISVHTTLKYVNHSIYRLCVIYSDIICSLFYFAELGACQDATKVEIFRKTK